MIDETKVKEVGKDFVQALNSKNEKEFLNFIEKYWDAKMIEDGSEDLVDYFYDILNETDCIKNPEVILENETKLTIIFNNTSLEEWVKCYFVILPQIPITITGIGMVPLDSPLKQQSEKILLTDMPKLLDEYLSRLHRKDLFSGIVVLAENDKIIYQNFLGFAEKAFGIGHTLNTRFDLGSMCKMFTALSIGKLIQEGKISFEDTIAILLPDLKIEQADRITIHHLLSHTSGLGDFLGPEFNKNKDKYVTIRDLVSLLENKPLNFIPGAEFKYSNGGFDILGLIIERISGINYFEFVKKNIFEPAGMLNSDSFYIDDPISNRAVGYTKLGVDIRKLRYTDWKINTRIARKRGCAAGGTYSTVADLLKFSKALKSYKILNQSLTTTITSEKVQISKKNKKRFYGYGFGVSKYGTIYRYGHNGSSPGVDTYFGIFEPLGYTFIILSNYDFPAATRVVKKFEKWLINATADRVNLSKK